jgi:hypothetical protein
MDISAAHPEGLLALPGEAVAVTVLVALRVQADRRGIGQAAGVARAE